MDPAGKIAVGKVCITTSDQATQLIKGLKFRFYDHKIESMAALEDLYPAFEGISECLRPYHQKTKQDFGIAYEGFISIQQEGKYTFHILLPETSDIQLSLNDQKVSGNDERKFEVNLKKGMVPFDLKVTFSEGNDMFLPQMEGPGTSKNIVNANILFARINN